MCLLYISAFPSNENYIPFNKLTNNIICFHLKISKNIMNIFSYFFWILSNNNIQYINDISLFYFIIKDNYLFIEFFKNKCIVSFDIYNLTFTIENIRNIINDIKKNKVFIKNLLNILIEISNKIHLLVQNQRSKDITNTLREELLYILYKKYIIQN